MLIKAEVPLTDDFLTRTGTWWDNLTQYQRGMLCAAHRLQLYGVNPNYTWCELTLHAQTQIALRVMITAGVLALNQFPELPEGASQVINDLPTPDQIH